MGKQRRESITKIVVLGGGYGGIKALETLARSSEAIEVTLVDHNAYHYLQTESYNFIAAKSSFSAITISLEELVRGFGPSFRFVRDEAVELEEGRLRGRRGSYAYDYLIIAVGSATLLPGVLRHERLYGVKTLPEATHLKHAFEELLLRHLEGRSDPSGIVVVGGGSSGVEIAAEMRAVLNRTEIYRSVSVTLIADRFLTELDESSRRKALELLENMGIRIVKGLVERVESSRIHAAGESFDFDFGVLATGIAAVPFLQNLPFSRSGPFLEVDRTLRIAERIYAIGDCALLRDRHGHPLPPTAQTAEQSGTQAAENILRQIHGSEPKEADLKIYGLAVALGGKFAIAVTPYLKIDGILAYLGKKAIEHYYKIPLRFKSEKEGEEKRER